MGILEYYSLRETAATDLTASWLKARQDASDSREAERRAAVRLQSAARSAFARTDYKRVQRATNAIARAARGFLGRRAALAQAVHCGAQVNMAFFDACATVIQRFFRGYYSRRTKHNYRARKAYISQITDVASRTTHFLHHMREGQIRRCEEEAVQAQRDKLKGLAGQLHHLVSTATIPGVYNPPYADDVPRALGVPLEEHLKTYGRVPLPHSLRRPRRQRPPQLFRDGQSTTAFGRGYGKTLATDTDPPQGLPQRVPLVSRAANVGRLQPLQGPFRGKEQIDVTSAMAYETRSLQAQSHYDEVHKEQRSFKNLSKFARIASQDFVVKHSIPDARVVGSVNADAPYLAKSQAFRGDYDEIPKIKDKPAFLTALPRGRLLREYDIGRLLPHGRA